MSGQIEALWQMYYGVALKGTVVVDNTTLLRDAYIAGVVAGVFRVKMSGKAAWPVFDWEAFLDELSRLVDGVVLSEGILIGAPFDKSGDGPIVRDGDS